MPLAGAFFDVYIDEIPIGSFQTDKDGIITVTYEEFGQYLDVSDEEWIVRIVETKAPAGYLLPEDTEHIKRMDLGMTKLQFEVWNSQYPMIEINKYETGTLLGLSGAVFSVKIDTSSLGTWETDENGKIFITYDEYKNFLTDGKESWTVTVEEMLAPAGYINDNANQPVSHELLHGQSLQTFVFWNTKYPDITIKKVDREDPTIALEGATFKFMIDGTEIPGPWVTDHNGEAIISWDTIGRYLNEDNISHWTMTATEFTAPTNYNKDAQPSTGDYTMTAQLQNGMTSVEFLFSDTSYRSIEVTKKDSGSGALLAGAEFTLTAISLDEGVASSWGSRVLTTDSTGKVLFENVPNGTYQITETNAPQGYEINAMVVTVVVTSESPKVIEVDFTNDPYTSLYLLKLDKTDKTPVAGAKFKVETDTNSLVGTFETDLQGEILISGIMAGTYVVTEIAPPEGYEMDTVPQTVVVENGKRAYVEFYNEKQGSLILYLNDVVTNEPLQGGEFELRRAEDDVIITIKTTDVAGSIVFGYLKAGKYIITQNYAPENYWIPDGDSIQEVIIIPGEQHTLNFYNETSSMTIEKVDSVSLKVLEGARFKVTRNEDDLVIGEYETGRDGLALLSGLKPGMYTVQEIVAPDGYTLDTTPQIVEVKKELSAHVTFFNDPNSTITVHVVDETTRAPLANAIIEIWKQNGEFVSTATTDSNGVYVSSALTPGYYVVKLNIANVFGNYNCDVPEVTLQVVDGTSITHFFECYASGNLEVRSTDSTGATLSGMTFTLTKVNGEIIGTYTTSSSGNYIITGLDSGTYVVTPTVAPDGYTLNSTPVNVIIENGKTASVTIANDKVYGLQIFTTDVADSTPVSGVTYQIKTLEGVLVATAISDHDGLSFNSLTPGYYVVTPTSAPDGYVFTNPDSVTIEVLANGLTTMAFTVQKISTIKIKFVDGTTNLPIYGVRALLETGGETLEILTSDANGYVSINQAFVSDAHTVEVISVPDGYRVDNVPRPIATLAGGTTEIVWTMYKDAGQIQVALTSSAYNITLDKDAGSSVQGAVFEIQDPYTYKVMGYMITDANGIAGSAGLPIGRYLVKQVTAAPYYDINTTVHEVFIKVNNDVVRLNATTAPITLNVEIDHETNASVGAGMAFRVDITKANNNSDVRLDNFFMHIKVPTDGARAVTLVTGIWNHPTKYSISYKTNMTDYRLLSGNLQADNRYQYEIDANSLGLQMGEYLTDIRFEFGTVPAGFHLVEKGALQLYSLSTLSYEYNLITRMEAGGMFSSSILSTNGSATTGTTTGSTSSSTSSSNSDLSNSNVSSGSSSATTAYIVGTTGTWKTNSSITTTKVTGGNNTVLYPELPKTGY